MQKLAFVPMTDEEELPTSPLEHEFILFFGDLNYRWDPCRVGSCRV